LSPQNDTHIFILAAGKGTRMHSALPKIMHKIAGLPLIGHVLRVAESLNPKTCTLVIAPQMKEVQEFAQQLIPAVQFATQDQQLGTAHAVQSALAVHKNLSGKVIIVFGDTPLIQTETLKAIEQKLDHNDIVLVGMRPEDSKQYARIILNQDHSVHKIVEYKDATEAERAITICNSGMVGFNAKCLQEVLPLVEASPLTNEYYLFETISFAKAANYKVGFMEIDEIEAEGVNTRADLAHCEHLIQQRYRQEMLLKGVTLIDPSSTYFSYDTQIAADVVIEPQVFFGTQVTVESGAQIKAFSHIEQTTIGQNAVIGPFARLRAHTEIGPQACIGNFVEVTQSKLGMGAKAKHLTYLGNSTVGDKANIGAGTITCNYDGTNKWPTTIGAGAFIGSNTSLIAPVNINAGAIVGAGSTITRDVDEEALALTRPPQQHYENGAKLFRAKCLKLKEKRGKV
jgi:bifunctional UDP-N-acetylglucosamine pyrophosphorylase/glucosamine-1-phosphate N-acetyltransferase